MFERGKIEELLGAVGAQLEMLDSPSVAILVIGGAALNVLGLVSRVTRDIDCLAFVEEDKSGRRTLRMIEEFPDGFKKAAERVASDFGLPEKWINFEPTALVSQGLPEGIEKRLECRDYGSRLKVYFIGRLDQIHFKLYAAELGPGRHVNDLLALNPTFEEVEQAARWCLTQDPSEAFRLSFKDMLKQIGYGNIADRI